MAGERAECDVGRKRPRFAGALCVGDERIHRFGVVAQAGPCSVAATRRQERRNGAIDARDVEVRIEHQAQDLRLLGDAGFKTHRCVDRGVTRRFVDLFEQLLAQRDRLGIPTRDFEKVARQFDLFDVRELLVQSPNIAEMIGSRVAERAERLEGFEPNFTEAEIGRQRACVAGIGEDGVQIA